MKKKKMNIKFLSISAISFFFLLCILLVGFMGYVSVQNYQIDESKLQMNEATIIYDLEGNEASKLFTQNREYLTIDQIPEPLQEAFIAVEDQRFYEHRGIDPRSITRALYRDILARSAVEGGSTITQQLAKNVFLTNEKKLMRKTEEVLIAINLEKRYTKEKILEMYLNYIYFGHGAHGISAAAQVYFDKEVKDLNLSEIAMLAALPKAPSHYSPLEEGNEERSEQRRQLVLRIMSDQGRITIEQKEEAVDTPLVLNEKGNSDNPALDTYIDMVVREAKDKYGLSHDDLYTGGYKIYTKLDQKAQEAMYEAIRTDSPMAEEFFPAPGPEQIVQGSMVIMDHSTGGIAAVMGGRDYVRTGTNRATADARSPGSTFKPIATYAPALEQGWHPYDLLVDERISFGNYNPRNYDGNYRGRVTMMDAVRDSINVPAVWLLNELGVDKGVQSAQNFGIEKLNRELGIALGGGVETSPLGMAKAFGAIGNHGVMMEPFLIEKMVDRNGLEIAKNEPEYKQVISAQSAWYMTKMLQNVIQEGTGKRARLSHDVAGKTGTTQGSGNGGSTDAWFVGYTPKYVAAVWMGFDKADENHIMQTSGGNHPARIFKYVMEKALEGQDPLKFKRPEGVKELEPPVRFEPIQDLQAFLNFSWDLSESVDIDFTPNQDERIGYKIYRIDPNTNDRQLLAEVTKSELVDGRRWSDPDVSFNDPKQYQVVPYNLDSGQEGEPSNVASVQFNTSQFENREGVEYEEDFEEWLQDLLDRYNNQGDGSGTEDNQDDGTGDESSSNDSEDGTGDSGSGNGSGGGSDDGSGGGDSGGGSGEGSGDGSDQPPLDGNQPPGDGGNNDDDN